MYFPLFQFDDNDYETVKENTNQPSLKSFGPEIHFNLQHLQCPGDMAVCMCKVLKYHGDALCDHCFQMVYLSVTKLIHHLWRCLLSLYPEGMQYSVNNWVRVCRWYFKFETLT